MNVSKVQGTADKLLSIFTLLAVKLIKMVREESAENPSSPHYRVLFILMEETALPVSEIGKRLAISKPNMTKLVDRLIAEGMVERLPDENDRRIINIAITDKGKRFIEESMSIIKEIIKRSLSNLDESEFDTLYTSLENIENLLSKAEWEPASGKISREG